MSEPELRPFAGIEKFPGSDSRAPRNVRLESTVLRSPRTFCLLVLTFSAEDRRWSLRLTSHGDAYLLRAHQSRRVTSSNLKIKLLEVKIGGSSASASPGLSPQWSICEVPSPGLSSKTYPADRQSSPQRLPGQKSLALHAKNIRYIVCCV